MQVRGLEAFPVSRKRRSPSSPEAIALAAAKRREAERLRAAVPETWGVANDTIALPSGANVETRMPTTKRVIYANRCDPFDRLFRRGGLTPAQHQAARRLFTDLCERQGVKTRDPVERIGSTSRAFADDLVTVRMVDAGKRFDTALALVGRSDADVLNALVQPDVMCGTSEAWRQTVERLTDEANAHAQASVVRRACENLRLAYVEIDNARWRVRIASVEADLGL